MIGPTMIPAPQIAIALPCSSRVLMLRSTVWLSGTSAAPQMPCSVRKTTISVRLVAMPQSIEATTKPADRGDEELAQAHAVGEPAGHRRHDRRGDDVGGEHPGDLVLRRPERALHRGQRHVGDRGVEHLHDRRQHDRDGDQPLVGDRRGGRRRRGRGRGAHCAGAATAVLAAEAERGRARASTTFGRPRAWPVSTSTLALMPVRSAGSVLARRRAAPGAARAAPP